MIIDAKDYPDNYVLQCDLCVVGSGPASLSLISQFLKENDFGKKVRIVILESGNTTDPIYQNSNALGGLSRLYRNVRSDEQHLYEGKVNGWLRKKKENYLTESRLRGYGGTGNIWSGWFWTLEPHDLIRGGWPISYNELEKYYKKACVLYNLPNFSALEIDFPQLELPEIYLNTNIKEQNFKPRHLLFKRINFGQAYKTYLAESKEINLILNANVTHINLSRDNVRISDLEACVPISEIVHKRLKISADQFILAAGCLETTRLLQLSGIGNSSGLLGKFFQEHFYLWNAGIYHLKEIPRKLKNCYFLTKYWKEINGVQVFTSLVPTKQFLEWKNCNNFRVLLGGAPDIPNSINLCWEQDVQKSSEISLDTKGQKDRFGNAKIIVKSSFSGKDFKTLRDAILATKDYLENQNIGEHFQLPDLSQDPLEWPDLYRITPGNHPCGTTRMSMSSAKGVVDPDCKVHGVENLYICSSSVFPSGGYANPTLTIIALALRLSNHLKKVMRI